jgi:hypothetical protein
MYSIIELVYILMNIINTPCIRVCLITKTIFDVFLFIFQATDNEGLLQRPLLHASCLRQDCKYKF